jgi:Putative zinc-finger
MSELSKIARARLQAGSVGEHPDADVLTAFFEQALPDGERQPVLAHLATCADCRLMVALAMPPATEPVRVHAVSRPATTWGWSGITRWASVAACLVVVGAAVMIYKPGPTAVRPASDADVPVPMKQEDAVPAMSVGPANSDVSVAHGTAPSASENIRQQSKALAPGAVPGKQTKATSAMSAMERMKAAPVAPQAAMGLVNGVPIPTVPAPNSLTERTAGGVAGGALQKNATAKKVAAPPVNGFVPGTIQTEAAAEASNAPEPIAAADLKAPGRAKGAAPSADADSAVIAENRAVVARTIDKQSQETPASASALMATVPAKWTLSKEGQLQRSFDGGTTWDAAPVVDRAKFLAFSVVGVDVWAGGAAGLLYHSADNGLQWTPVKPTVGGVALSADIKNIDFTDLQHGTLTTADSQKWTTTDGGGTWQVAP